jgi:hypothetical protein
MEIVFPKWMSELLKILKPQMRTYIALRNNSIQILPQGIFDNHTFKDIDLSFIKIHTIPKDLFRNNCTFGILSLNNNFLNQDTIDEISKVVKGTVLRFCR